MQITTKYDIEDIVYLVTDTEQLERQITGISIYPNNLIMYSVLSVANITNLSYRIK